MELAYAEALSPQLTDRYHVPSAAMSSIAAVTWGTPDPSPKERDTCSVSWHEWVPWVQRLGDVLICDLLILVLLPVLAVIALLIKRDSPGPILFKQTRVGKDGQEFGFFKFRSMVADAKTQRYLLERRNERSGPVFKMKDDPRVTRAGHVLRRFSLDELP